ncbi:THEMIS [Pelobates cultripes]|uniref:THEMIS n=1 Tax=Pelobates cultripes TaxID=61616 RepID=A0AAD1RDI5_PELCU|nr:THEMIS [Pelobates cultripes]
MTTTLKKFIESLDPKTLPRVLQIQSGYYGVTDNECSISTGEVITVTGYKVQKVRAHIHSSEYADTVELPLNFPGLFKIVPDKTSYYSIEEIVKALHVGHTRFGHPGFYSCSNLHVGTVTVCQNEEIIIKSVEDSNGVMSVNCEVFINGERQCFVLPLSYKGEFYEYKDEKIYTLKEITDWKIPKCRKRTVILTDLTKLLELTKLFPNASNAMMTLEPVYEIQALLEFGKDIINLLTDLDIEVLDITQKFDVEYFIQILTTHEIFERTSKEFPMIAEIIEGPLRSHTAYRLLQHGKKIIIHAKYQADRVIASELRSDTANKHFLIPSSYKGRFKRRPRFFPTVYDLNIANRETDNLHVVATKAFQSSHQEFSSVNVGDQFQAKHFQSCKIKSDGKTTIVDALVCAKMENKCCVKSTIPLYVEGGFMEVVHDKRQYYVSELCKDFQLPVNVKVSVRDLFTVAEDILAATSVLQLEEQITDSYLLVSLLDNPKEVWELPVHRVNLTVRLIGNFYGDTYFSPTRTNVEEINEEEYYMLRRYESHVHHPPPRPPKTPVNTSIIENSVISESNQDMISEPRSFNQVVCSLQEKINDETLQQSTEKNISTTTSSNTETDAFVAVSKDVKEHQQMERTVNDVKEQFDSITLRCRPTHQISHENDIPGQ